MMPNEQVSEVLTSIRQIGSSIGRREKAEQLVTHLSSQLDSLRVLRKGQTPIPAVLLIGRNAGTLQNMTVAGSQTYIDELWRLMGGENIYRDLPTHYGAINLESLLIRNPTVIIEFNMQKEHSIEKENVGPEWQLLHGTKAIKNGYLFVIGGNHTMIPGPRLTMLARDFYEIIQQVNTLDKSPIPQSK
jgi:ABC-type hemin transport system substrate-binding protein